MSTLSASKPHRESAGVEVGPPSAGSMSTLMIFHGSFRSGRRQWICLMSGLKMRQASFALTSSLMHVAQQCQLLCVYVCACTCACVWALSQRLHGTCVCNCTEGHNVFSVYRLWGLRPKIYHPGTRTWETQGELIIWNKLKSERRFHHNDHFCNSPLTFLCLH